MRGKTKEWTKRYSWKLDITFQRNSIKAGMQAHVQYPMDQ